MDIKKIKREELWGHFCIKHVYATVLIQDAVLLAALRACFDLNTLVFRSVGGDQSRVQTAVLDSCY